MTTESTLERLYDLRELQEAGYGDRSTLTKLIKSEGIPAVRIGRKIKVRESDLPRFFAPVGD